MNKEKALLAIKMAKVLLKNNEKILAVKLVRVLCNASLEYAKSFVEALEVKND